MLRQLSGGQDKKAEKATLSIAKARDPLEVAKYLTLAAQEQQKTSRRKKSPADSRRAALDVCRYACDLLEAQIRQLEQDSSLAGTSPHSEGRNLRGSSFLETLEPYVVWAVLCNFIGDEPQSMMLPQLGAVSSPMMRQVQNLQRKYLTAGCLPLSERTSGTATPAGESKLMTETAENSKEDHAALTFYGAALGCRFRNYYGLVNVMNQQGKKGGDAGGVLVSINGLRVSEMTYNTAVAIIYLTTSRPIRLEVCRGRTGKAIRDKAQLDQGRDRISKQTVLDKLQHSLAKVVLKKMNEFVDQFNQAGETQALAESVGTEAGPGMMVWSCVRYASQQVREIPIFDPNHAAGGGLPEMGPKQFEDVDRHLQDIINERTFSSAIRAFHGAPENLKWAGLPERLAALRFISLSRLGLSFAVPKDRDMGDEWIFAQTLLSRMCEAESVWGMLEILTDAFRVITAATQKLQMKSCGKRESVTADDLMPAIIWTVIQANPPNLASRLWFLDHFTEPNLFIRTGEAGFMIANLVAAVEFSLHLDPSSLTALDTADGGVVLPLKGGNDDDGVVRVSGDDEAMDSYLDSLSFEDAIKLNQRTQECIAAVETRDVNHLRRLCENFPDGTARIDPNALRVDQKETLLSAAVRSQSLSKLKSVLTTCGTRIRVDTRISPCRGPPSRRTALMIAAASPGPQSKDMVLELLSAGAERLLRDGEGLSADDLARAISNTEVLEILRADPRHLNLLDAIKAQDMSLARGLLAQGARVNELFDSEDFLSRPPESISPISGGKMMMGADCLGGRLNAVMLATSQLNLDALRLLLANKTQEKVDVNLVNERGCSALMFVSWPGSLPGGWTSDTARRSIRAAVYLLGKGADRYLRDTVTGRTCLDWIKSKSTTDHPCLEDILRCDPLKMDLVERAEAGDRKAVQALLEQGVDPNVHGRVDTRTALIVAAVQHDKTLCNLLLSHPRINIDDVDGNGETCLMYAVREVGRVAVSVCRNEADDAALEVAVDIVRLLMKKGANRYVSSKKGITAMHLARVQENTPASPMIGKERNDIPHAQVACVVDHDWQAISSAVSRHPSFLEMQALLRYDPTNLAQEDVCGLALRGDLNGVRSLLQQGVSPNAICRLNPYGKKNGSTVTCDSYYTPLIGACSGGHITVVQFLLDEENIRTDLQNPAGQSALFFATISESRQSEDIVVALLKAGASRYIKDRQENTPWMWGERRIAALQKMTLDKSRDHKYRLRNSRNIQHILRLDPALQTIQSVAAAADLFGVIALVRQGVDVNNCKPDISVEIEGLEESSHISVGETALIAAVRQSAPVREEKASRLTFSLLTSEPKSKRNLIAEDALKMIKLLLENQYTKVDLIDSSSRSALMHAVEVCSEQAVIILLGAGADRYWSNEACGTALDRALALGYNGIGKILATDPSRTSLTEAAISGDTETMDALRKQGVDPNQGGPLIAAAKSNQQEAVQFLLGMNGILVNKQNRLGETALMHAAGAGSMDVCYDLLRAGADGTIRDNLRMSSVDWAVRHGITTKLRLSVAMMTHGK